MIKTNLRPLLLNDLTMILNWRNDDAIRHCMVNSQIISYDEHLAWFERNKEIDDKYFLVFEYEGISEGYVSFIPIANSQTYEWGFYIRPNAIKGMGAKLGQAALDYAFGTLGLKKVFGQVLDFNEKSINFHHRLGFIQEGKLRQHFHDDRGTFDIYQFGLLNNEWVGKQK